MKASFIRGRNILFNILSGAYLEGAVLLLFYIIKGICPFAV
jgi:hypothetical protein